MPKLVCSPASLNPRCGEQVKVRLDADPPTAQLAVEPLVDSGAVAVTPTAGTTDANGVVYFWVQCENRGGACEGGTVTFKATGFDSCTLWVGCHAYPSLSAISLPGGMETGELLFARDFLDTDEREARVIAYGSARTGVLTIGRGMRAKVLATCGVAADASHAVFFEGGPRFRVDESDEDGDAGEDDVPTPNSVRIIADRACGKQFPLRRGNCNKVGEIYMQMVQFARGRCVRNPDHLCVERWIPWAELRVYAKPGCQEFIEKFVYYGWLCGGNSGPPRYY